MWRAHRDHCLFVRATIASSSSKPLQEASHRASCSICLLMQKSHGLGIKDPLGLRLKKILRWRSSSLNPKTVLVLLQDHIVLQEGGDASKELKGKARETSFAEMLYRVFWPVYAKRKSKQAFYASFQDNTVKQGHGYRTSNWAVTLSISITMTGNRTGCDPKITTWPLPLSWVTLGRVSNGGPALGWYLDMGSVCLDTCHPKVFCLFL